MMWQFVEMTRRLFSYLENYYIRYNALHTLRDSGEALFNCRPLLYPISNVQCGPCECECSTVVLNPPNHAPVLSGTGVRVGRELVLSKYWALVDRDAQAFAQAPPHVQK